MASIKVFNLRYLTKHILSFCGLEERILLRDVNKIANGEYNTITPNSSDVETLLGDRIISSCITRSVCEIPDLCNKSYLFHEFNLSGKLGPDRLGYHYMYKGNPVIFTCRRAWNISIRIVWCIDKSEIMIIDADGYDGPRNDYDKTYKCSAISVLNNLPIMIKRESKIVYPESKMNEDTEEN